MIVSQYMANLVRDHILPIIFHTQFAFAGTAEPAVGVEPDTFTTHLSAGQLALETTLLVYGGRRREGNSDVGVDGHGLEEVALLSPAVRVVEVHYHAELYLSRMVDTVFFLDVWVYNHLDPHCPSFPIISLPLSIKMPEQKSVAAPAGVDFADLTSRAVKYALEGLAVAVAAYLLPGKGLKLSEIGMIALVALATFAILDIYAPSVGSSARTGAGFGIGANLVGFP
jgi:hypothetical protein